MKDGVSMKCEKCGKEFNGVNYCPTCRIQEDKGVPNQTQGVKHEIENIIEETIRETAFPKLKGVNVFNHSKRWDITVYYLLFSFVMIAYISYFGSLPLSEIRYESVPFIFNIIIIIFVYMGYAFYVNRYLIRTFLRFVWLIISFVIYIMLSIMIIFLILLSLDDQLTGFMLLSIPFMSIVAILTIIPFILIHDILKKELGQNGFLISIVYRIRDFFSFYKN